MQSGQLQHSQENGEYDARGAALAIPEVRGNQASDKVNDSLW